MAAASVTPAALPMPPSRMMDTKISDSLNVKLLGAMKPTRYAERAPASPVRKLPTVKARIFQRATSNPNAAAAVSSSRTASRARPTKERSMRKTSAKPSASRTTAASTYLTRNDPSSGPSARSSPRRSPKISRPASLRPCGPPSVSFTSRKVRERMPEAAGNSAAEWPAGPPRGSVAPGPDPRRGDAAREEHQRAGDRAPAAQHGGGVAADAEEGRAGEVHHAGGAKLQMEAQAGERDHQHAGDEEEREGVVAQQQGEGHHSQEAERRPGARRPRSACEGSKRLRPQGERHGHSAGEEQRHGVGRLGPEKEEQVRAQQHGSDERGSDAGKATHTRSLAFSPMRPVGRNAISTITTPKANPSLYAL